jgi:hypothetical protein
MAITYEPIATTTVSGSPATDITFTGITGTYTDIVLVCIGSPSTGAGSYRLRVGNGSIDTGNNYSRTVLSGTGSTASSERASNTNMAHICDTVTGIGTSNIAMAIVNLQNYSNTTTYKTILARGSSPSTAVDATVNLWTSTSAINQIRVFSNTGNLAVGFTATLYGIKAA